MNPLASVKCAGRLLMALVAGLAILFAAGCGSSSTTPPNQQGFSNASLNGTYVFSTSGVDSNVGLFLATAGTFTANGTGGNNGITGGMIDINGFELSSPISTPITSGSYNVNSDGRGQVVLKWNGGSIKLDFVLTASAGGPSSASLHGLVTEFDDQGTGSGTLDMQNSGSLQASYTFGLAGASFLSSNELPLAMVGTFTESGGTISPGLADINSNGVAPGGTAGLTLTGTVTAGSPGTATLSAYNSDNTLIATYNFDVYMVDDTHLKFIETDAAQILAGDAFTQQSSIPNGVYAYTMEGLDNGGLPLAMGGFVTAGSEGQFSAGLEDYNDAGTVVEVTGFTGSSTAFAGGRTELTLNGGFYNGNSISSATFAAYPSSGGIDLLEIDSFGGITGGIALPQGTGTSIAPAAYVLNLSAINGQGFEEDDIAEFTVTGSNFKGAEDINDEGSITPSQPFNGTFTADTTIPGHGLAASTSNEFNFAYYVANSGATMLILETDNNQLGVGAFEVQTTNAVAAVPAPARFATFHPKTSAKASWRKRNK
jgi:hypothetical protein